MRFKPTATSLDISTRLQKRREPVNMVDGNLPLVTFYKLPGSRGLNHLEYVTPFDFDIYTDGDVELAINIADRINYLFDGQYLSLARGSTFKAEYVTSAEDKSDLEDVFKYFTQISFTFGIEG